MGPTILRMSVFMSSVMLANLVEFDSIYETDCSNLRLGQYICPDPSYDLVDPKTQQPRGCTKMNLAKVLCRAADGIICHDTKNSTFYKNIPCKWTNGYSFETALLLSIFLGMFGVDRFYLGYPGHGLLKLCSLGYMFIGQLYDILKIATQTLRPADGSYYVMAYFGPGIEVIRSNNETFKLPQDDWY
ncbi:TM2 domain-containing protein biscotti [Hetaerina americana]|uniref:TM2 domain-containing protein biscotti n=1 Tax=Hetaerina americana TaxID=62018 RepID=UPI003A7F1238